MLFRSKFLGYNIDETSDESSDESCNECEYTIELFNNNDCKIDDNDDVVETKQETKQTKQEPKQEPKQETKQKTKLVPVAEIVKVPDNTPIQKGHQVGPAKRITSADVHPNAKSIL